MNADPSLLEKAAKDFPFLVSREQWGKKITSTALASKNIKRLLAKNFPDLSFRVKSDIYSMGSSVYIYWDELEDESHYQAIDKMLTRFQSRFFNGMDDSTTYDRDPYNMAFRELFGSASSIVPQPRKFTPQEMAQATAQALENNTVSAAPRRKGPRL